MIGYLQGEVIANTGHELIVNVQGVGYRVLVPTSVAVQTSVNQPIALHCHLAVREDALTLYGFLAIEDQQVFEHLISVSGVGPKLGLAILSNYSSGDVRSAVAQDNAAAFSAISGIGTKNANRIVLELKHKLGNTAADSAGGSNNELADALIALGYSAVEATKASQQVNPDQPLPQQIKQALSMLS